MTTQHSDVNPQSILATLEATIRAQVLSEQQTRPQSAGPRLLNVEQAAEYLGRTESAVRQLVHKKLLPVVRFDRAVRIDIQDLEKLIANSRV